MSPKLSLTVVCPNIPLREKILKKNHFKLLRGWSSLLNLLQADKGQQTLPTRGKLSFLLLFLGTHLDTNV
jgi:hypothetical protein